MNFINPFSHSPVRIAVMIFDYTITLQDQEEIKSSIKEPGNTALTTGKVWIVVSRVPVIRREIKAESNLAVIINQA